MDEPELTTAHAIKKMKKKKEARGLHLEARRCRRALNHLRLVSVAPSVSTPAAAASSSELLWSCSPQSLRSSPRSTTSWSLKHEPSSSLAAASAVASAAIDAATSAVALPVAPADTAARGDVAAAGGSTSFPFGCTNLSLRPHAKVALYLLNRSARACLYFSWYSLGGKET